MADAGISLFGDGCSGVASSPEVAPSCEGLGLTSTCGLQEGGQDGQVGLICFSDKEHTLTGLFFARRQLIDETSACPNTGTWQRAGHEGPWILGPWLRQPAQFSECFEIDYRGAVC